MRKAFAAFLAMLTVAAVALTFASCGEEKETTETTQSLAPLNTEATANDETKSTETEKATESEKEAASLPETTESKIETISETETEPATVTDTASMEELYPKSPDYTDLDFGGKEFKVIYGWAPSTLKPSGYGATYDIFENPDNPDEAITAAAALRVTLISTYYNCTIKGVPEVEPMSVCNTSIDSGSAEYELCLGTANVASYVAGNRYYNILNLIDVSKDYWDQSIIRDLSFGGKLYEITGDMSLHDDSGQWVLFFNKDILAENNLESPYELVMNMQWTIDKMMQMAAVAARDLDGDNKISNEGGKDIFGFITHGDHARSAWIGMGLRLASAVGPDGRYTIEAQNNTNAVDIYQKVLDLMWADFTGYANKQPNMGVPDGLRGVFIANRALFYGEGLGNIGEPCGELIGVGLGLKDYEGLNFGILPQPMYNEDQGQYYSFPRTACCYGVPSTADIKIASQFLDLWAFHGQQTIQKTYFEQVAYAWTSDPEVIDMMNIITHSAVWDAGYFIDPAALDNNLIADVGANKNRYASRLKAGADKLLASLDRSCDSVAGFDH